MSDVTFALAISHTPWIPERVKSMTRLCTQLLAHAAEGLGAVHEMMGIEAFQTFEDRCPNYTWHAQMCRWVASTEASHGLFLQDDVEVAPNFWPALKALVTARPDAIIALEAVHPGGQCLARAGVRGYTTSDGLIGVGYVIPRYLVSKFQNWKPDKLRRGAIEDCTEDCMLNLFALDEGIKIFHPCPTLITHDTTLASTYGNDSHSHRAPTVTWRDADVLGFEAADLEKPEFWGSDEVPHLGRFYGGTIWKCRESRCRRT
jgi:hypothetical protein